jgi:hypothetical protein
MAQFSKIYRNFYPKTWHLSFKKIWVWFWDPGPEIKKAPDPVSGSATLFFVHNTNILYTLLLFIRTSHLGLKNTVIRIYIKLI